MHRQLEMVESRSISELRVVCMMDRRATGYGIWAANGGIRTETAVWVDPARGPNRRSRHPSVALGSIMTTKGGRHDERRQRLGCC